MLQVFRVFGTLLLLTSTLADKQIKLEDIEKDNLKAAEQAKYERNYPKYHSQNFPQQYQYQPPYTQQAAISFEQPSVTYQSQAQPSQSEHSHYSPYILPFNPAQLVHMFQNPNYAQIASNALGTGQQPQNSFLQYFSQQLQPVSASQTASPSHQQPVVMAFSSPSMAAFQQQANAYYQGLGGQFSTQQPLQYLQAPSSQSLPAIFYQPQTSATPVQASNPSLYTQQQFLPPFQSLKLSQAALQAASVPQYNTASFSHYTPTSFRASLPQTHNQIQSFTQTEEPPASFATSLKTSSAASIGQQQQYLQTVATASTPSPLQTKYINSPQYLAQNYNTIPSSVFSKSAYSSVKPTASTPLKVANQGGFVPNNPSIGLNYQYTRSLSG